MVAAAVSVQATTNPIYATIVLLIAALVVEVHGQQTLYAKAFPIMVALATIFGAVRVALTVVTTHATGSTVLFTWPFKFDTPEVLGGFTIFGTFEQEPLVRSAFEAYAVVAFIAVFAAWNTVVSHHEVMRAVPRAFHEPALVVAIAIAFVPSTIVILQSVRLADRARCGGVPVRQGRLRRYVIPVVEGGLERAIALAESMESRGLGHARASAAETRSALLSLAAMASLGGAVVALISRARLAAGALGVVGVALFVGATVSASRANPRTRYRPQPVTTVDRCIIAATTLAVGTMITMSLRNETSLSWSPQPFAWPGIHIVAIVALLGLTAPVFTAFDRHQGKVAPQPVALATSAPHKEPRG